FTEGASTVTRIAAAQTGSTLNSSNGFYNLAVSGTITESTAIDVSNSLTVAGTLTTGGFNITGGSNLVVPNGGTLAAGASACTFTNVTMTGGASGTITLTGAWTVSGSWNTSGAGSTLTPGTSTVTMTGSAQAVNLLASASWAIGTATVTFKSSSDQTMTFAALPGNAPEFNNVVFNSGAATVAFTMATNALVWSGTLTIQSGSGTTTLATSNRGLTGGALIIGNAGALTANASTV